MKEFEFWKYHGCGNDFLILEEQNGIDYRELAIKICDRHLGIGADGILLAKYNPLSMRIINSDGSEAAMCGNGIRCFLRFCIEQKHFIQKNYEVMTKAGMMYAKDIIMHPFHVTIDMGIPDFQVERSNLASNVQVIDYPFYMHFHIYMITTMFLGTIHTVIFVSDVHDETWVSVGFKMHQHPFFRSQTNVNFVEVVDSKTIKVRTYEKGVGMTLACGSGACASAYCAFQQGFCDATLKVELPKGILNMSIVDDHVLMSGGAQYIGKGMYMLEEEMSYGCETIN